MADHLSGSTVELPVLGVPVRFDVGDRDALEAVESSFGQWRQLAAWPGLIGPDGVRVRIALLDDREPYAARPEVSYDVTPERVTVRAGASHGFADLMDRTASASVTRALLNDRPYFRYAVLEALTLVLVTRVDRQPMHGALLRRNGVGIMLAGPTGTGKSSVSYAARADGFEMLSDDAAYVQLQRRPRVWGVPGQSLLPEDVADTMPELRGQSPKVLPSGKRKTVAVIAGAWTGGAPAVERVTVCLLQRDGGTPWIRPAPAQEVSEFLVRGLGAQRALYPDTAEPAARWLAGDGGWRINLSADPTVGVRFVHSVYEEVQARGI